MWLSLNLTDPNKISCCILFQGPSNPNVFQLPDPDKGLKLSEDEKARVQALKDSIIRLINGVRLLFSFNYIYYFFSLSGVFVWWFSCIDSGGSHLEELYCKLVLLFIWSE